MKALAQASNGLIDKRRGFVRIALAAFLLLGFTLWILIGNAAPASAATAASFTGGAAANVVDPVLPNGDAVGNFGSAIFQAIMGGLLYLTATIAMVGAIFNLLIWTGLLSIKSRSASNKTHILWILGLLAIAGVTGWTGNGLFVAAMDTFGRLAGGGG